MKVASSRLSRPGTLRQNSTRSTTTFNTNVRKTHVAPRASSIRVTERNITTQQRAGQSKTIFSAHTSRFVGRDFHSVSFKYNEQKQEEVKKEEEKNEQPKPEETKEEAAAPLDPKDEKIQSLEKEIQDLKKQLMYVAAERENIRRIGKEDVEKAKDYGISNFAKMMLEVADNLGRCLAAVTEEQRKDPVIQNIYEGVELTEKELMKSFNKTGITKFDPMGQKFDPNIMNAMAHTPMPGKEANTVGFVMKPGYMIKDRVLRAADVIVVKGEKPAAQQQQQEQKQEEQKQEATA